MKLIIWGIIIIVLICIGLVFLPLIINYIYYLDAPMDFFVTDLQVTDFVAYYASALSFLGTIILGMLTLYQNKKAQDKSDEVNRLQLEMQRRSMALAEAQYNHDIAAVIPKFTISLSSYSGHYLNPRIRIRNVSSQLISDLSYISSYVKNFDGEVIRNVTECRLSKKVLSSNEETIVDLKMLNLSKRTSDREYTFFENVEFIFEFSCEDEKYNKHYYRATLKIPNTKEFVGDNWKVEKVG